MDSQTFQRRTPGLSEDEVKRRFVPFLREFYRKRFEPMPGSEAVELDNVGEGGLVADGKMTFRKADGSPFVCTYEATSRDKAEEVKFAVNEQYLVWDAAAFGAIAAAVLYAIFFVTRREWLIGLHLEGNLGLVLGLALIAFLLWFFLFRGWRKYRYIYAIEQFKQYQADEQWVAIAEDVFPSPTDPYLIELRNQCVFGGFGLAVVTSENGVRSLANPSRLGLYGEDRRITHWVTRADWYQAITQNPGAVTRFRPPDALTVVWNKVSRPLRYLLLEPAKKYVWGTVRQPLGQTATAYNRFMSGQQIQKWICGLALLLLVPLAWRVVNARTDQLADLEDVTEWRTGENPEDQLGYLPSDERIPYGGKPTGVPKQFFEKKEEAVSTINLSGDDDETPTLNISGDDEQPTAVSGIEDDEPTAKPSLPDLCAVLAGKHGWLVQDNLFITRANATERVATLRKKGLTAQVVNNTCIEAGKGGYLVWMGKVQATRQAALTQAANYEKTLLRYGLLQGKLSVKRLL